MSIEWLALPGAGEFVVTGRIRFVNDRLGVSVAHLPTIEKYTVRWLNRCIADTLRGVGYEPLLVGGHRFC